LTLARLGRNEEALPEARKALQLDPGHSSYRFMTAVVLFRLGREEEANFHLKKAAVDVPAARQLLSRVPGQ
jgi:Flp pilus assembly protein TadD